MRINEQRINQIIKQTIRRKLNEWIDPAGSDVYEILAEMTEIYGAEELLQNICKHIGGEKLMNVLRNIDREDELGIVAKYEQSDEIE